MINILVEGMTCGKGGKEAYIINLFRAFDKENFSFTFIAYDKEIAYQEELMNNGAQIVWIPPRDSNLFIFRRELDTLLQREHFDVIWAHKTTLSSCEILEKAKKYNVPIRIVHSHSSANMGGKLTFLLHVINKQFIRVWANEFFACSDAAAKWFYGDKPFDIIPNGIDVDKFKYSQNIRDRIRKELGLDNSFVIGHVGRFGIEKNHKKLISIFSEVKKDRKDAKLVLCGDGEERNNIETKIKAYRLEDSVLLLGVINNVNEVLQAMDVMIMPSLFEGLPFALLEAQTAGLKCIVSDTISRESDLLGNTTFLKLTQDDKIWAKQVLSSESENREWAFAKIREKGFDINENAREIEALICQKLGDFYANL